MIVRLCWGTALTGMIVGWAAMAGAQTARLEAVPQSGHTAGVTAVAFQPGAAHVLTGASDGSAVLWDAVSGRLLRTYRGGPLTNSFMAAGELQQAKMSPDFPLAAKERTTVADLAFGPDGRWFVMVCRGEGFLSGISANTVAFVWDVESGKKLRSFDLELDSDAIALSPDGKLLLNGGQPLDPAELQEAAQMGVKVEASTGIGLWDMATGKKIRGFGKYDITYHAVAFSPDGKYVFGGGQDLNRRENGPPAAPPVAAPAPPPLGGAPQAPPPPAPALPKTSAEPAGVGNPPPPLPYQEAGVWRIWETATGKEVQHAECQGAPTKAAFSPRGDCLLTVCAHSAPNGTIEIWDVKTGKRLANLRGSAAAFSADGTKVFAVNAAGMLVAVTWDAGAAKETPVLEQRCDGVKSLAVSRDGKQLLLGMSQPSPSSGPNTLKQPYVPGAAVIYDAASGRPVRTFSARTDGIDFVAISPTGRHLLIGDGLWDTESGQKVANLCAAPVQLFSAAFAPDGSRAVVANHASPGFLGDFLNLGGMFGQSASVLASIVEIPSGKELQAYKVKYSVNDRATLGYSRDGKRAMVALRSGIMTVCDPATGKVFSEVKIACNNLAAAMSPDVKTAAVSFTEAKTTWWDRQTGKKAADTGRQKGVPARPGMPLASRDSKYQLSVNDDATAVVVQKADQPDKPLTLKPDLTPQEGINTAGFDGGDDRFVYVEIMSPYAGLLDLTTGERLQAFPSDEPFSGDLLAFTGDGKLVVSAGEDGQVMVWDAASGKRLQAIPLASPVLSLALGPDGKRIAAGCADRTVVLMGVGGGEKTVLRGHEAPVDAVAFRADGKLLLSVSREEGSACLWDIAGGKELARVMSLNDRKDWLAFTPEGVFDGSEEGRKLIGFRKGEGLDVVTPDGLGKDLYRPGLLGKVWRGE